MENRPKLLRVTTVPISLKLLLNGQLSFFQKQGYDVLSVSADGPEIELLKAEGIAHETVNMTRKITPIADLTALISLVRVIRRFKPDIVHSHTPKAGLLSMIAAWLCRVPVRLHTVAGLPLMEAKGTKRKVLELTEKITYRCATGVYVNSKGLKSFIERNIYSTDKLRMIGKGSSNGIDTAFYQRTDALRHSALEIRSHYGIRENDMVFCFVGRIVRDKGIGELLYAFRKLLAESTDERKIYLLLVGPFEQDLDPITAEDTAFINSSKQVIHAGFQRDVRQWMVAADVFVFPSYREGFPNVVMQASCLQVPAIVSDINGCNEIVQHNETGLIVPPKNALKLFEAMRALYLDDQKVKRFASVARNYVAENFSQHQIWLSLQKEYEHLLNR